MLKGKSFVEFNLFLSNILNEGSSPIKIYFAGNEISTTITLTIFDVKAALRWSSM